jgi:hypothetical protein
MNKLCITFSNLQLLQLAEDKERRERLQQRVTDEADARHLSGGSAEDVGTSGLFHLNYCCVYI